MMINHRYFITRKYDGGTTGTGHAELHLPTYHFDNSRTQSSAGFYVRSLRNLHSNTEIKNVIFEFKAEHPEHVAEILQSFPECVDMVSEINCSNPLLDIKYSSEFNF